MTHDLLVTWYFDQCIIVLHPYHDTTC